MAIVTFVLVGAGVALILLGAWMSMQEWNKRRATEIRTQADSLSDDLSALTKLVIALRDYPPGQQLIVWGIVILIIAGIFGGITKM